MVFEVVEDPQEVHQITVEDCKARALMLLMDMRSGLPALCFQLAAAGLDEPASQVSQLQTDLLRVLRPPRRRRSRKS